MASQAATGDWFDEALDHVPLLGILRGLHPSAAVEAAERCWAAGVPLVEVSLSGPHAAEAVEAVCARGRELGRAAGVGTAVDADAVRTARAAGAAFAVAPSLDGDAVAAAQEAGIPYLPGVATPSEVQRALALGCRWLKLFPAAELGLGWLRSLEGPFPSARFVAVGGIDGANAAEWVAAGAAVGIGSALLEQRPETLVATVATARSR